MEGTCSAQDGRWRRLMYPSDLTGKQWEGWSHCKCWQKEPDRFIVDPTHQMLGLNTWGRDLLLYPLCVRLSFHSRIFAAFPNANRLIYTQVEQYIEMAAWPCHFNAVHFRCGAQAEVNSKVVLRDKAAAAPHFINLSMTASNAF